MAEGVDYSSTRPNPAQLYALGKRFVVRYGGPGGDWKHLTAAEAQSLTAAGLALVANAEGTADGMLGGFDTGFAWAHSADLAFQALGMPNDRPIYLSVDFDCGPDKQWAACAQALKGAAAAIGPARVGVYGSYDVMQWAKRDGVARWYWQAYAWSSGQWAGHNHLEQYRNGVSLAGGTVDLCRSKVADYGQWGVAQEGTEDMFCKYGDIGPAVKYLQFRLWHAGFATLVGAADSNYGDKTAAALKANEAKFGLTTSDGRTYGPDQMLRLDLTWGTKFRGPEGPKGDKGDPGTLPAHVTLTGDLSAA
jgi:Rv2525c-like, glycoside hydrolase-like domain/Putative peptidoglycan binding domain